MAFIQASTSDNVLFDDIGAHEDMEAHRLACPCPKDLERFFIELSEPRQLNRTFAGGENPIIGATFLHPDFCLGTINRGDLWNQRRSLLAYWGETKRSSYLRVRFLHDGYDFAAAQFFSKQQRGNVIFGVVLATDGGDTHVNLDRLAGGKFTAHDLRLRFEFGGQAADVPLRLPHTIRDNALLPFPGLDVRLTIPYAAFDGFEPFWQGDKLDGKAFYDVVFYEGADREFDLTTIKHAAIAAFVGTGNRNDMRGSVQIEELQEKILLSYDEMELTVPTRPATKKALHEIAK